MAAGLSGDAVLKSAAASAGSSYGEILKSTLLIGGSSVLNIAIGIFRTKAMAVLLGPAGFGLMGVYTSIADLTRSAAELGINSSGVRQIAESIGSGDGARAARTIKVLRRTAIALGSLGALLLLLFARPISQMTFGDDGHAGALSLLSAAVFLRLIADGQGALIQGLRRISDMARIAVLGALLGTVVSIAIVYWLRRDGIVPALVGVAALSAATSWWYSRKVRLAPCTVSIGEVRQEAGGLLKLGLAFMGSALLTMGAAYAVRLIVLRGEGLEAAGFYQAAWTLGGLYVGLILQAMGADFYPRLVAAAGDHRETNRLVNEQTQVSLLLAGPGVIGTLTFAALVIALFYSPQFGAAVAVLRWICLGMALRVIAWPLGYIIVSQNRRLLFFAADLAWTIVNLGLSWWLVRSAGLVGAGVAFFASYVFHAFVVYAVVRHISGFRWSTGNRGIGLVFIASTGLVFGAFQALPAAWAVATGALVLLATSAYSVRLLLVLVPPEQLPRPLRRLFLQRPGRPETREPNDD